MSPTLDLAYPFEGRWLTQNSPGSRVPSHGTTRLATAYAIDFVPVEGAVVAVHDEAPDHGAYRGLPSVRYALTQRRRLAAGWAALAGNHVMIETGDGTVVAVCHLQRGSIRVRPGQSLQVGEELGWCGNSGNSTEPHVHLQAMDHPDPSRASAVAIAFDGHLPRNGEVVDAG